MIKNSASTTLFAVRHGETEWNTIGRQQGHLNSPLSESGIRQAYAVAEGLSSKEIKVIYSSNLGRALQTATIIANRLGLNINLDSRLRERNLGILQGLTIDEFREQYPEENMKFRSNDPDYQLPGGESINQRHHRCISCCSELAKRNYGRKILIVAHGGVISSLLYHALRIPLEEPRRFSLFNAAINSFSISEDTWKLDTWGDISHLGNTGTIDDQ